MFGNDERAKRLFSRYPSDKLKKFKAWHSENPHVYSKFKELAYEMKKTGRSRYSAETIINVLRWHTDLTTTGSEFKISNDYRSIYARLLAYQDPEFENFFSFKGLEDEDKDTVDSMGMFKKLAVQVDEGNRDAMFIAAEQCRINGNYRKALQLYDKLGKDKEAQALRDFIKAQNAYDDSDVFA